MIATDAASFERLGAVGPVHRRRAKLFINIDHHESNTRYADLNWVSAREPSTGELIFRLLKIANWPITQPIADCLFTAVSTDTGSFQYPTTRPGHLSCRRRTGPPRRQPRADLRRSLSILSPFPRPPAAARLQPLPAHPRRTRSPISGSRKPTSPARGADSCRYRRLD